MANHTFTGIRVTGSLSDATASFAGLSTYLWYTPDIYNVIFYDSTERVNGELIENEFGMLNKRLNLPEPFRRTLDSGSFDQRFAYDLTFGDGDVTRLLQLYDSASDTSFLFALDGTALDLPNDQASLTAWLQDIQGAEAFDNPNQSFDLRALDHIVTRDRDVFTEDTVDQVNFNFGAGNDVIYVGGVGDQVGGGAGNDKLIALENAGSVGLFGGDGDDYIKFRGNVSFGTATGDNGDDRIIGNDLSQTIFGGAGSDVLFGLGAFDTIQGDDGDDFIYAGQGADIASGGEGNDVVRGNRGDDVLIGDPDTDSTGSDRLYGGGGHDELQGAGGRDFLLGENGNDRLDGGTGDDNLTGGAGGDAFVYVWFSGSPYSHGYDRVLDFEDGIDVIDLRSATVDSMSEVLAIASDTDDGVRLRFDAGKVLFLDGMSVAQLDADDFLF